jgi:hypothetical protein
MFDSSRLNNNQVIEQQIGLNILPSGYAQFSVKQFRPSKNQQIVDVVINVFLE